MQLYTYLSACIWQIVRFQYNVFTYEVNPLPSKYFKPKQFGEKYPTFLFFKTYIAF